MKKRINISVDENILKTMKENDINLSQFCEEQMKEFIQLSKVYDLTTEIQLIEEQKKKLDQKLFSIHKYRIAKHELNKFNSKNYREIWNNFIENFEDWYYIDADINLPDVIRISGLQEPQLENIGLFITEYEGEDKEIIKNNIDYAIMKYNEENIQPIRKTGGYEWW